MKLTIQSTRNAQTIVDLFNAIITGNEADGATPLSIYDEDKHICSLVGGKSGEQILELIIEREVGDKLQEVGHPSPSPKSL